MNEFESTLGGKPPISEICVLYEARTGRIVYTQEFIGDGTGIFGAAARKDRERIAMERVKHHGFDARLLRVLHAPRNFKFEPNAIYRVDPEAKQLVPGADVSKAGSPLTRKPAKRLRRKSAR